MTTATSYCVDRVLSLLADHRQTGSGWSACCPAHDDSTASLSIAEGDDGRALLHCHAGCNVQAIVDALGIELKDLMPPREGTHSNGSKQIVATYDYQDEQNNLLFQVVRYFPKDFRQRKPKDGGGWDWSVKGMRVVPYRLHMLIAHPDRHVVVVEGEKDVLRLASLGVIATCNAGGAGKWTSQHAEFLRGRKVIVIPDNDEAGRKHAKQVAKSLKGLATSIKLVELPGLPPKGDVSDWIDAGGTVEQLRILFDSTPEWIESASCPEPTPERPASYTPFPIDCLPEPMRSFVVGGSTSIGCDPAFVALPVMAMAAAAIGNSRRLCIKRGWIEPSILWTCIVGDSGSSKSPALELALRPIRLRQQKAIQIHRQQMQDFEGDLLIHERNLAAWKRSKIGGEPPEPPTKPIAERYWCDDQTIEALALMLQSQQRGLLLARDELAGWLCSMDQYKSGQGSDVSRWLEMFGGRQMLVDRKTGDHKTIFVPMASMSITGGVQPEVLARSLGRAYFENGLAARLLLAFPPRHQKRWTEADIDPDLELRMTALVDGLYALEPAIDEAGDIHPVIIGMNTAAKAAWIDFYNRHASEQADLEGDLAAAWSKLEGYAARLALVVHCIRVVAGDRSLTSADALDQDSIQAGIRLSRWFGSEAKRVYGLVGETDEDRDVRRLIDWIERRGGETTVREVQTYCRWLKGSGLAEQALTGLVKSGIGSWIDIASGARGGRPVRVFRLSAASASAQPQ